MSNVEQFEGKIGEGMCVNDIDYQAFSNEELEKVVTTTCGIHYNRNRHGGCQNSKAFETLIRKRLQIFDDRKHEINLEIPIVGVNPKVKDQLTIVLKYQDEIIVFEARYIKYSRIWYRTGFKHDFSGGIIIKENYFAAYTTANPTEGLTCFGYEGWALWKFLVEPALIKYSIENGFEAWTPLGYSRCGN